jgi:hypothetical protein
MRKILKYKNNCIQYVNRMQRDRIAKLLNNYKREEEETEDDQWRDTWTTRPERVHEWPNSLMFDDDDVIIYDLKTSHRQRIFLYGNVKWTISDSLIINHSSTPFLLSVYFSSITFIYRYCFIYEWILFFNVVATFFLVSRNTRITLYYNRIVRISHFAAPNGRKLMVFQLYSIFRMRPHLHNKGRHYWNGNIALETIPQA